jgi:hypothetical protein
MWQYELTAVGATERSIWLCMLEFEYLPMFSNWSILNWLVISELKTVVTHLLSGGWRKAGILQGATDRNNNLLLLTPTAYRDASGHAYSYGHA